MAQTGSSRTTTSPRRSPARRPIESRRAATLFVGREHRRGLPGCRFGRECVAELGGAQGEHRESVLRRHRPWRREGFERRHLLGAGFRLRGGRRLTAADDDLVPADDDVQPAADDDPLTTTTPPPTTTTRTTTTTNDEDDDHDEDDHDGADHHHLAEAEEDCPGSALALTLFKVATPAHVGSSSRRGRQLGQAGSLCECEVRCGARQAPSARRGERVPVGRAHCAWRLPSRVSAGSFANGWVSVRDGSSAAFRRSP